jgi:hypothetical protein
LVVLDQHHEAEGGAATAGAPAGKWKEPHETTSKDHQKDMELQHLYDEVMDGHFRPPLITFESSAPEALRRSRCPLSEVFRNTIYLCATKLTK